jgi:hypothetical protein
METLMDKNIPNKKQGKRCCERECLWKKPIAIYGVFLLSL